MPGPTVRKLLKLLSHSGLLASTRGAHGGYRLGREASSITVEEIIATIEGPVAMTECNAPGAQTCERRDRCPVKANWQQVNRAIHSALEHLTLSQMAGPLPESWSGGPANGESP
jgi:Rrf2 family protein